MPATQKNVMLNLGPQSRRWLEDIGIADAEALRRHDPFEVYARLRQTQPRVSVNLLYALIGAVEGLHWQEVQRQRRTEILMRLDDLGLLPRR